MYVNLIPICVCPTWEMEWDAFVHATHKENVEIRQRPWGKRGISLLHQWDALCAPQPLPVPRAQSGSQQLIFNIPEWMTWRHGTRACCGLAEKTTGFSHFYIARAGDVCKDRPEFRAYLHKIGASIAWHLKLWLTSPGCVEQIRLLFGSTRQGCWILILYLFYCCWNKHFIFRENSIIY